MHRRPRALLAVLLAFVLALSPLTGADVSLPATDSLKSTDYQEIAFYSARMLNHVLVSRPQVTSDRLALKRNSLPSFLPRPLSVHTDPPILTATSPVYAKAKKIPSVEQLRG